MKVKGLFLFLTLAGLGTSCTNDDGLDKETSLEGGSNEIQLVFSGSGEGVDYTKAIASESENEMRDLKVYIFASKEKDGTYYYVESWTKQEALTPGVENIFTLRSEGSLHTASIKPKEFVGLPYLKLYCVANSELYAQDGATLQMLTPLTAYNPETGRPTPAKPTTATDFEASYSTALVPDPDTGWSDRLMCPLPMGGIGITKISGSLSKVNIEMLRAAARFDVYNDKMTSSLNIYSISVMNARKNAPLFSTHTLEEFKEPSIKETELVTYTDVPFNQPNANRGDVEGAIYLYPGMASDSTVLLIKGAYQNPHGQSVEVAYPIALNLEGERIAIGRNNRYKLRIGSVTESQVNAVFEIADWTSAGEVADKPENLKPVFEGADGKDFAASVQAIKDMKVPLPVISEDPYALRMKADEGGFQLVTYSSSLVEAELQPVIPTDSLWFTQDSVALEEDTIVVGRKKTTFFFKYTKKPVTIPYTVTLRNASASYDPDLWTVIDVKGSYKAPFMETVPDSATLGNALKVMDDGTFEGSMYVALESELKVKVTAVDGLDIDVPDWLTMTPVKGTEERFSAVYSLKVTGTPAADLTDAEVYFINQEKTSLFSSIPIKLLSPLMDVELNDTYEGVTLSEEGSEYTIRIDADVFSGSLDFIVNSPEGFIAPEVENVSNWFTMESNAVETNKYTVSFKNDPSDYAPCTLTFANAIPNGGDIKVTFKKNAHSPMISSNSNGSYSDSPFNPEPNFDNPQAVTADMYKLNGSKVYIHINCEEGLADFAPVNGLSIAEVEKGIYEIAVTNATALQGESTEVIAVNKIDDGLKAKFTIYWMESAVSYRLQSDGNGVATIEGNIVTIDFATWGYVPVVLKLSGYKGSSVSYSGMDNGWASFADTTPTEIPDSGEVEIPFSKRGAGAAVTDDIVITVHNALTDTDETFILRKK